MSSSVIDTVAYTPEQVAQMLQLSKGTVYDLINRGELIAKKIGKVYRIPAKSVSFVMTGLDEDIYQAEQVDRANLGKVEEAIREARRSL